VCVTVCVWRAWRGSAVHTPHARRARERSGDASARAQGGWAAQNYEGLVAFRAHRPRHCTAHQALPPNRGPAACTVQRAPFSLAHTRSCLMDASTRHGRAHEQRRTASGGHGAHLSHRDPHRERNDHSLSFGRAGGDDARRGVERCQFTCRERPDCRGPAHLPWGRIGVRGDCGPWRSLLGGARERISGLSNVARR
jgi:hypothetical protein